MLEERAEIVVIYGSCPRSEKYRHTSQNIISKKSLWFPEETGKIDIVMGKVL